MGLQRPEEKHPDLSVLVDVVVDIVEITGMPVLLMKIRKSYSVFIYPV